MKRFIQLTIYTVLILAGFESLSAQETKKTTKEQPKVEYTKSFDIKNYQGWQKIDLKSFSFYAPKELLSKKVRCIDSECYEFSSDNFRLNIDVHIDAGYPVSETKLPSYSEKHLWNEEDRAWSWLWFYDKDVNEFRHIAGVYFSFPEKEDYRVQMSFLSKEIEIKEMAEKMFSSVRFKFKIKEDKKEERPKPEKFQISPSKKAKPNQ